MSFPLVSMDHAYIDEHRVAEAYVAGVLPDDESAVFIAHFSDCDECRDRLELARLFRQEAPADHAEILADETEPETVHSVNGHPSHSDFDDFTGSEWVSVTIDPDVSSALFDDSEAATRDSDAQPRPKASSGPSAAEIEAEILSEIGIEREIPEIVVEPSTMELIRTSQFKPWVIPTIASLATTMAVMMEVIRRQQVELAKREAEEPLPFSARFVMQFKPWQLVALGAVAGLLLLLMPATYFLWELTQLIGR